MKNDLKDIFSRVEGKRGWGQNIMPLQGHDNLLKNTPYDSNGFVIKPFLDKISYEEYINQVNFFFLKCFEKLEIKIPIDFTMDKYHLVIMDRHLDFVNLVKHLPSEDFPINAQKIVDRVSEILGFEVTNFNPFTKESVFHYRIIRPKMPDYNPLHRDTWHTDYDDCVNIYVGLFGSNELSSLPFVAGSHYWSDADLERTPFGAKFNNLNFTVPAVTNSKKNLKLLRPNPRKNEIMVFTPYAVHGAAANWNSDITRVSLEMRFWRK